MSTIDANRPSATAVKAVRRFNRFYTRQMGVLEPYLGGDLSLTQVRVLYELAHRPRPLAGEIARDMGLDAGYLSRILRGFDGHGWVERQRHPGDARQSVLHLTPAGRAAFEPLQQRSRDEAAALLGRLAPAAQQRLVRAMETVESLLGAPAGAASRTVVLRDVAAGDMGWVVQQHGELYAREYGFTLEFEALVADIAARFVREFKPGKERGWIAELDGERVGAVFVVRKSAATAQLRLLLLTPQARGLGIGARLTDECIAFARQAGYRKMVLWTNSCLAAARGIYAARGFRLDKSEPYEGFGQQLVGENWSLTL